MKNPESTRDVWRHWSDPKHRNAKPPEWLADMRERIVKAQGERMSDKSKRKTHYRVTPRRTACGIRLRGRPLTALAPLAGVTCVSCRMSNVALNEKSGR